MATCFFSFTSLREALESADGVDPVAISARHLSVLHRFLEGGTQWLALLAGTEDVLVVLGHRVA